MLYSLRQTLGRLWPERERRRRFKLYLRKALAVWLDRDQTTVWLHVDQPALYLGTPVDVFRPMAIKGWALTTRGSVTVSILCDGTPVGDAMFGIPRPDVLALTSHLHQSIRCGFQYILEPEEVSAGVHTLTIAARASDGTTTRNSCTIQVVHRARTYASRRQQTAATAGSLAWMRRHRACLPEQPGMTLCLNLTSGGSLLRFQDTLRSLQAQAYPHWQLGVACEKATYERLGDQLTELAEREPRLAVWVAPFAGEPALFPLDQAAGQFLGLVDAGDLLEPDALFEFAYHLQNHPDQSLVYCDRDGVFENLVRDRPPLVAGATGPGRLWLARRESIEQAGGLPSGMDAAAEQQFLARLQQVTGEASQLPRILYSQWQKGPGVLEPEAAPSASEQGLEREPVVVRPASAPLVDADSLGRILVVRLDHLGDVLLTVPALERLRELFPEARITALVGGWSKTLAENHPAIDEVLTYDFFHANSEVPTRQLSDAEKQQFAEWLTPYRFDLAVDFRREPETRELLRWSGARYTAGFAHRDDFPWLTVAVPCESNIQCQRSRRHVTQELLQLVEMIGVSSREDLCPRATASVEDRSAAERQLQSVLPAQAGLLVAIHPGSGRPIKCWPAEYFARLADQLCEQRGALVVFFGGPGEVGLVQSILEQMRCHERAVSLAGQLSVGQLLAALAKFDLYIGNDSGPTHLAAGTGVPTLCICSGTNDPIQWAPLGPAALTIQRRKLCSPCYLRHPDECPYQLACLTELSVEDVLAAAVRALLPRWSKTTSGPAIDAARIAESRRACSTVPLAVCRSEP
jgi:ADP-heptose:LPS heptosyltransferase